MSADAPFTRILLVDDESELRELIAERLREEGYTVFEASGGHEAFDWLSSNLADLVITDLRMPKGDGRELLRRIQQSLPQPPPVFVTTGFSDFPPDQAFDEGAAAYFSKPFSVDALVTELKRKLTTPRDRWQRRHPRLTVQASVLFSASSLGAAISGRLVNVGRGGLFVSQAPASLPKVSSDPIEFLLTFDNNPPRSLAGLGVVRWIRSKPESDGLPTGFGLEFIELEQSSLEWMLDYLSRSSPISYIPNH